MTQETLRSVAAETDLFLYDLKMMNTAEHREWTGVGNERILENLRLLSEMGKAFVVRIPMMGGINDGAANLEETGRFLAGLGKENLRIQLLPYHKIAQTKYQKLGRPGEFRLMEEPTKERLQEAVKILADFGLVATVGG
ncbi:MAG: hypothetical protein LWW85_00335 [Marinilabiliales bacterium]|nr:hypothetical protein [Marinilabiliales bacterium]